MILCFAVCRITGGHFITINNIVRVYRQPCRRGTAVPAFPPPDSPLCQFPVADKAQLVFPFDYDACVRPIKIGLTRGLLLGFLPPTLNFFSVSAGC